MAILINIGRQSDGCVYELDPLSQRDIRAKYPTVRAVPFVHIGYDKKAEFEELQRRLWKHVAMMLTGLTWKQIQLMGGAQLYDPVAEKEVARVA